MLSMTAIAILAAISFTACDDGDDDYWWGTGTNTYYDTNLYGTWELIQINERAVTGEQTNYLEFTGQGMGYYFYYSGGLQNTQRINWICNAGYNRDTISIRYQDGSTSTMNYYFGSGADYLYLQWNTAQGNVMTYCYRYIGNRTPW